MSNSLMIYVIGILFTWGLFAAGPNWEAVATADKALIVFVWPVSLGALAYTYLYPEEEE